MKKLQPSHLRNIIFGAEDSLVSTLGVLFGIATAVDSRSAILLTGLVVISVEALSMGAGAYLSETETKEVHEEERVNPVIDGILMFISYFLAGFIPLFPYLIFDVSTGRYPSVVFAMFALFVLGYIPQKSFRAAFRMAFVAGLAVLVGYLLGSLINVDTI